MDSAFTPEDIKQKINNLLWEVLPDNTTLKEAEELACKIFSSYMEFVDAK